VSVPPAGDAGPARRLHDVDRVGLLIAVLPFAALMAVSPLYGFDRDELYFLDCARHLQLSYVDQPILVPLLARASLQMFGVSLSGLRLWAALAAGGTVAAAAMIAREFGGGSWAQRLTAVGVATSPVLLGADHIFGPTALDILAWTALAWAVVRLGRTGDPRLWLVIGIVLGLGEENKHSILFFAAALIAGTLLSGGWRVFATRWLALGVAATLLLATPDIWWQATHGWATIAMTQSLNAENGGPGNVPIFIVTQIGLTLVVLIWVWVAGLVWLWRRGTPLWRALAWAYGLLFAFFALTAGAKAYYIAGAYPYLMAAGAAAVEGRLAGRLWSWPVVVGAAVNVAVEMPLALPVLPPQDTGFVATLNTTSAETIGWPELVRSVASVWDRLPASQRADAVIFTTNYGEAGAVNELGGPLGLPGAVSGHNTEWWWGPGNPHATTVVVVGAGDIGDYATSLQRLFGRVRRVATITNADGIRNQEDGGHLYICSDPVRSWGQMWPELRHYD
jgi:4-amino-4-deoxy-L-arabinose transferase-like glycosyltransferase